MHPTVQGLLLTATQSPGFDNLLNNDVPEARRVFGLQPESPFSLLGLGLTSFLAAALGQEDKLLAGALAILYQAETAATRESGLKRAKSEPATVFPPGVEYKVSGFDETCVFVDLRWGLTAVVSIIGSNCGCCHLSSASACIDRVLSRIHEGKGAHST